MSCYTHPVRWIILSGLNPRKLIVLWLFLCYSSNEVSSSGHRDWDSHTNIRWSEGSTTFVATYIFGCSLKWGAIDVHHWHSLFDVSNLRNQMPLFSSPFFPPHGTITGIHDIPTKVIFEICSHLPSRDQLSFMRTSLFFHNIITFIIYCCLHLSDKNVKACLWTLAKSWALCLYCQPFHLYTEIVFSFTFISEWVDYHIYEFLSKALDGTAALKTLALDIPHDVDGAVCDAFSQGSLIWCPMLHLRETIVGFSITVIPLVMPCLNMVVVSNVELFMELSLFQCFEHIGLMRELSWDEFDKLLHFVVREWVSTSIHAVAFWLQCEIPLPAIVHALSVIFPKLEQVSIDQTMDDNEHLSLELLTCMEVSIKSFS